jgi:hypothetical protein
MSAPWLWPTDTGPNLQRHMIQRERSEADLFPKGTRTE